MSWPKILAYLVVAALLTVHLLSVARERAGAKPEPTVATAPFLVGVPERIDRVRIEKDDAAVQVERKDGRWVVTEPEGIDPPGDVIDAVLDSLTSLPPIEIVADGIEHQGQFGLLPPRARIRIEQQGELVSTIILGELSPTRTAVYAKRSGKEEVALIGLNSKYYIDLIFESVRRQQGARGGASPAAAGEMPGAPFAPTGAPVAPTGAPVAPTGASTAPPVADTPSAFPPVAAPGNKR